MNCVTSFSHSLKYLSSDVKLYSSELSNVFDGFCLKLFM